MEIEFGDVQDGVTQVRLRGRLDTAGADRIGIGFTGGVVAPGRPALVDLSGVDYVSSMGIRLLISSAKALHLKGARLVLVAAQPLVQEVFEQAGLDQILDLAADETQARAKLTA